MLTITDHGTSVTASNLIRIASGLRNPAGFAFHPATGDLYFQDNGIDGLVDPTEAFSADELNFIARANIGGPAEYFGFPTNYTAYRTGDDRRRCRHSTTHRVPAYSRSFHRARK